MNNPNETAKELCLQILSEMADEEKDTSVVTLNTITEIYASITVAPEALGVEALNREVSIAADKKYSDNELLKGPRTVNNPSALFYMGLKFAINHLSASGYLRTPTPPSGERLFLKITEDLGDCYICEAYKSQTEDELPAYERISK